MVAWWQIVVTVVCILLSGTFSGLTLGLMSLDIIDLRVLTESGTEKERWYATRILPVRRHGNWLLCTLLIGNTAVNSALAIVTADLFGGIAGFLTSTITILYVGEIVPQAVCHRFGLVIGAYAIPFVKLFMFLTAPLSFTTAKALDFLLGGESVTRYNKSQLKSLLSIHGTQAPDHAASRESGDPSDDHDGEGDGYPDSSVVVTERHQDNVTIVELPQISSRSPAPAIDAFTPFSHEVGSATPAAQVASQVDVVSPVSASHRSGRSSGGNVSTAPSMETPATGDGPNNSPVDSPSSSIPHDRGKGRTKPLPKFYNLKPSRMFEKRARKEKEREKKDRESESSNPPLTKDEMAMLGGAFDFSQKTVAQVMTALDNVFMLEASLSLNFEVLLLIFQSGHSRVPVYDKTRDNIIGVLFAKDLILLDPEDSVPIKTVLLFFNRTVLLVFFDTPLNKMLNIFKQGGGHMAIVQQISENPGNDPVPDTLGVVTLEDLIEELIGQDIVDETDVYTDNISKQRVKRVRSIDPEVLKMFDSRHSHEELLSEKEVLVVASYLSNNTEEFSESLVKMSILKQMLSEIPIVEYHSDDKNKAQGGPHGIAGLVGLASASAEDFSEEDESDGDVETVHANGTSLQIEAAAVAGTTRTSDISQSRVKGDKGDEGQPADITIYTRGVPTKNAYLIINGHLEICAGSDGFISEAGPWTLLGISALTNDLYAPDFTARVTECPARLLRIPRKLYRLMVQYSATANPMATVGDGGRAKKGNVSPLTLDPATSSRRRVGGAHGHKKSSSSLALAAAAAAVAVGNPKHPAMQRPMPGTASDATVVRKTRARTNGQSIEWSEMEPLGQTAEVRTGKSVPVEARLGRSSVLKSLGTQERVDIVKPLKAQGDDKPPNPMP